MLKTTQRQLTMDFYSTNSSNNLIVSHDYDQKNYSYKSTKNASSDLLSIHQRRYIGNKTKLSNWIMDTILSETKNCYSFCDIFAGTATVANKAFKYYDKVIVNDLLHSNNVIYKAFFNPKEWDRSKIFSIIEKWNKIESETIKENYFSENFGGKFFEKNTAKIIGHIREDVENKKNALTEKEYSILLATLIYNIDKVANTVGHFDAYIKKPIRKQNIIFKPINVIDFHGIEIYQENANELSKKISSDIIYIDPPYNSRQYSRFYHLYENLIKWEKPNLYGVALKPAPENMSKYCTVDAKKEFNELIKNINAKYIVVSYNNTYNSKSNSSRNKIELEEIQNILSQKGNTKIFESSHGYFNTGKTNFVDHKELLFLVKTNEK